MKRVFDPFGDMKGYVTFGLPDGRRFQVDARDLQRYGLAELLRMQGAKVPTERVPVFQGGRQIGTLPAWFDPLSVRSQSFLYSPRSGDFVFADGKWEADRMLGLGDLDAIPEFRWSDADYQRGRAQRLEEERELLREVLLKPRGES